MFLLTSSNYDYIPAQFPGSTHSSVDRELYHSVDIVNNLHHPDETVAITGFPMHYDPYSDSQCSVVCDTTVPHWNPEMIAGNDSPHLNCGSINQSTEHITSQCYTSDNEFVNKNPLSDHSHIPSGLSDCEQKRQSVCIKCSSSESSPLGFQPGFFQESAILIEEQPVKSPPLPSESSHSLSFLSQAHNDSRTFLDTASSTSTSNCDSVNRLDALCKETSLFGSNNSSETSLLKPASAEEVLPPVNTKNPSLKPMSSCLLNNEQAVAAATRHLELHLIVGNITADVLENIKGRAVKKVYLFVRSISFHM